jgi:hypothetical protein
MDHEKRMPLGAPMHGGNVARLPSILPQRLAQGAQTDRERPLAHHRPGPRAIEQGRFGHHLPGLTRQPPRHGQGLGRHLHHLGATPQRAAGPRSPPTGPSWCSCGKAQR